MHGPRDAEFAPRTATGVARRARRADPDRRSRIIDAALDALVESGVSGTTHRAIAHRADVPLGSLTYHFPSLGDLVAAAFTRYVDEQNALYAELFEDVRSRDDLIDVLVRVVIGPRHERSAILGLELHVAALRDPSLRELTERWTAESRATLACHIGPDQAATIDALLEGMILHVLLSSTPPSEPDVRARISEIVPADPRSSSW